MEQIFPENWAILHLGLIFAITLAQMLVVYVLSDSSNPPAGLGLFTVYFMAALLGWIALTLRQASETTMVLDVPSVAAILNSYILFLAAGQRSGRHAGRYVLGVVCLAACLCVFFLPPETMFAVQSGTAALFFTGTGLACLGRSLRDSNVGDAIIACAALMMMVGVPVALYQQFVLEDFGLANTIVFGVHSCAYVLVAVGFLASVLIEYQQHLSHLATEDPLTRLLNRRGLEDALHISLAQASRHGLPTAAIMADIDHFKKVNDSFGHDTGDSVINIVAKLLSQMCRSSDVVARTGGEEFLIVLPGTDLEAAKVLAERIRLAIGEHPLLVDQQRIPVTISLGVASAVGDVTLDGLAQDADRAMYLAKQGGRNRVASLESSPVHLSTRGAAG
jgi:diguanylate cyclase (GGDEF)-like protein